MLRVMIAEDDPYMRIILSRALSRIEDVEIVAEVGNGADLVRTATEIAPDVAFVDIGLPKLSGLDAARIVSESNPDIFIVFATGNDACTHQAFELYAFDYLVKPFNIDRIEQTIERIKRKKQDAGEVEKPEPIISIRSLGKRRAVHKNEVIMVTRDERKVVIHTKSDIVETTESLQEIKDKLGSERFFRCHKGFIINTGMIREIIPCGDKTMQVKLDFTSETALITYDKLRELQARKRH